MPEHQRGIAFSLDALVAVAILVTASFLFVTLSENTQQNPSQTTTVVEDALFSLEGSGYIIKTIDTNSPTQAATLIRQQVNSYLPPGFDSNITVTQYTIDAAACAANKAFSSCFPDANKITGTAGEAATTTSFTSGKKYFVRRQPPGDCNVNYISFEELPDNLYSTGKNPPQPVSFRSPTDNTIKALFEQSDANISYSASTSPTGAVSCDQNIKVTLDVNGTSNGTRNPIDMAIILDKTLTNTDLNAEKTVMANFYTSATWSSTNDQIALATFDKQGNLKNPLKNPVSQATLNNINNLSQYNDLTKNAAADGLQVGLGYLSPGATNYRANSAKFAIILTDNTDTSTDTDLVAQASSAVSLNTRVFPIGIGPNAPCGNGSQLQQLATTTNGTCYNASDANALQAVLNIVAQQLSLAATPFATDSNVIVPGIGGPATIVDLNGGTLQPDGNILWHSGQITSGNSWTATYTLNFPCNLASICTATTLTFPGTGAKFNYVDNGGEFNSTDFNAAVTIQLKQRDLTVDINSGTIVGKNDVLLDTIVKNTGQLDSNGTTLKFYLNDTNTTPIATYSVPPLCSTSTQGCTNYTSVYNPVQINSEGVIYATINDDKLLDECPAHDESAVNCYGGPATQVLVVNYTVWRK